MTWRTTYASDVRADDFPPWQPWGSAARYEAKIWREFSLGNVAEITSQLPGDISDEEIGETLRAFRAAYLLPWEYSDEQWEQISCPSPH
jgi:hypothetical protein